MRIHPPFCLRSLAACAVALAALAGAPAALAHDAQELRIHARRTAGRLHIAVEADGAALSRLALRDVRASERDAAFAHRVEAAILSTSSDGTPVPLRARLTGPGSAVLEGEAPEGDLVLSLSLFGTDDPGEAVVRMDAGSEERLLRVELPGILRVPYGSVEAPGTSSADVGSFVRSGIAHILSGWDHLSFLVVLLVVRRRLRDVLAVASAFALAHSITLTLSAFDVVRVPSGPVEVTIAASIVLAALGNVFTEAPRHRTALAFGFGLVHGLGFASGLAELLEGARAARIGAVLGFNLGVELGQLGLLLVVTPLLLAWRRRAPKAYALVGVRATSVVIAALGLFWLAQRALA